MRNLLWVSAVLLAMLHTGRLAGQQGSGTNQLYLISAEYSEVQKSGELALLQKKYGEAQRHFKKVLKKYPHFAPALRGLGACYELKGNFEEAAGYYKNILETNPFFSRALYFECGRAFYQSGNYRQALSVFEQFDTLRQLEPMTFNYNGVEELSVEKEYYQVLSQSIRACHVALDSIQYWNIKGVFNAGSAINTAADEYFPYLTNDGGTIFYTRRKHEKSDENLYVSTKPGGEWHSGNPVDNFNTEGNEGMATLVRDNRRMFFTVCQRPEVLGPCDIWQAGVDGVSIAEAGPATGYINSGFWESQASINCDGSLLFFSSTREGGKGGADIWMSRRISGNRWGEPENLGTNINTPGDEEAPFISNDGKVLYFSSTGLLGMGEQDIFMSRIQEDDTWGPAINLGPPVNSAYRELGFYLTADGKTGYFASNRKGGYGGMDIYRFDLPEQLSSTPVTYVEGYVLDSITRLPVARATIQFPNYPPMQTDEKGRFFRCIPAKDTLSLSILTDDFHPYRNHFTIPRWDNRVFYSLNILLDPLFRLPVYKSQLADKPAETAYPPHSGKEYRHSVLYNSDEYELTAEERTKLNEFLRQVFSGKPIISLEIVGFADETGTDAYNLILSEKRAKSIAVFLKDKGLRVDKVYIEGRGKGASSKPRWQNRRADVVVHLAE